MCNYLTIGIYRKCEGKAALVFKKNKALYRITTIQYAEQFIKAIKSYCRDLKMNMAEAEYIVKIICPRNRTHVLEIGLSNKQVVLDVYELTNQATRLAFKWQGTSDDLKQTLRNFEVMCFLNFRV